VTQLLTFAPHGQGAIRAALLAQLVAGLGGGPRERQANRVMSAYGAVYYGLPALALPLRRALRERAPVDADPRLELQAAEGAAATRIAIGDWHGLGCQLDALADRWRRLGSDRGEAECRSLAGKVAFYEGHLRDAERRFRELDELSLRRPGDAWRAWGSIGHAEVALCLGTLDAPSLEQLLARATRLLSELENMDNAYTLRRLGLAARLAWLRGDVHAARQALQAATAVLARRQRHAFWSHEGLAAIGEGLLRWRTHEQAVGGALPPVEDAWRALDGALGRHAACFPAGSARVHRLRGQAALAQGRRTAGLAALQRAVASAERQGLRVELARSCAALAAAEPAPALAERAAGLWRDMGVTTQAG
jgi:hypothetical protein